MWICSSPSCCIFLEFTHIPSGSKTTLCLILLRDHFKDQLTLSVITTNCYLWVISLNLGSGQCASLPAVSKQSSSRNEIISSAEWMRGGPFVSAHLGSPNKCHLCVCKQTTAFQTFSPYMIVSEWNSLSPWVLGELKFVPMVVVSMNFISLIVWQLFVFRW